MPAPKPSGLIERHETAAEKRARVAREEAMRPARTLPAAPARLKDHAGAAAIWRRLMREYGSLEAEIVTRLDYDLLVDYCILAEQVIELDRMRRTAFDSWEAMSQAWESHSGDVPVEERLEVLMKLQSALAGVVKLDSRVDRKRDLLLKLRQSLYLTPRARAGAAPAQKEAEQPPDDFEMLLNEVDQLVNG